MKNTSPLATLLIEHDVAVSLPKPARRQNPRRPRTRRTYSPHEMALLHAAYVYGGFPLSKSRYLNLMQDRLDQTDFSDVVERFREALMYIHHDDWSMETISDAAHICAVVAIKMPRKEDA